MNLKFLFIIMYNPDISDYQLTSIITECCGGEAVVYSALYKPNKRNVAIKRYFVDKTRQKANLIQQEISTTKDLLHINILPYLTSFVHGHELYVVSPLMDLGSCRDILNQHYSEGLPELICAIILRDVLSALEYLHKQHYIHRGIRASHVLVSSSGNVTLSGLRSAACLMSRGRRRTLLHTLPPPDTNALLWLSPELLEQNLKGYDERSDIYSIGVLTCELANGSIPFVDLPTTLMFTEKVRGNRPQLMDCSTFPVDPCLDDNEMKSMYNLNCDSEVDPMYRLRQVYSTRKLTESFHNLSELCLHREAEKRPSASYLLSHYFFKQIKRTDSLPNLLRKVQPLQPQPDDISALLLEEKLSEMEIEKTTEWDF